MLSYVTNNVQRRNNGLSSNISWHIRVVLKLTLRQKKYFFDRAAASAASASSARSFRSFRRFYVSFLISLISYLV